MTEPRANAVSGMVERVVGAGARPAERAILGCILGAVGALAFAPLFVVPALAVAFTGLLWLLEGAAAAPRPGRARAWIGWWFGLGHFVPGLYWISLSLLTDPERFAWLVPFAVLGVPAGLALFTAAAAYAAGLARSDASSRAIALAAWWTIFEFARGHVLTGFPWNLAGYAWAGLPAMLQPAALVGAYGMSVWTVWVAGLPALWLDGRQAPRRRAGAAIAFLVVPVLVFVFGWVRLDGAPDPGAVADVRLRIVQPRIDQKLKWREEERANNLAASVALSREAGWEAVTHLVWPETATAYYLANDDRARARVAEAVPPGGVLLVGSVRVERAPGQGLKAWNSLHALDERGKILATYDKHHLVPFGEYVPLRGVLPIEKITPGAVGFSSGPGLLTLRVPGLPPLSPLICYEAIFPGRVARDDDRPAFLLNVTNDAWFGESSGPHQHFAAARMRAVEEGLPLVRAANTGISAVIDGHGRVTAQLDLGARGILDAALPTALPSPTPFARWGSWPLVLIWVGAILFARRPHRR